VEEERKNTVVKRGLINWWKKERQKTWPLIRRMECSVIME
jgi:hypothetical protein